VTLNALLPVARAAQRDALVCVFLRGGMDGLNTVVPYRNARYYSLRPKIGIAPPGAGTNAALDLDGVYGLHPALAPLKPLFTAGELAIVHAAGHMQADRSHFSAQTLMEAGGMDLTAPHGWLGRAAAALDLDGRGVAVSRSIPASLRGWPGALAIRDTQSFRLATRYRDQVAPVFEKLFADPASLGATARTTLDTIEEVTALDEQDIPVENGASYPQGGLGDAFALTARFIKSGFGQVYCLDAGGWDHHSAIGVDLPKRLSELGAALAAFRADLGARMNNTSVITMTEFGRRAQENASGGTDHGRASCMFALGGGVAGGRVYGEWPGLEADNLQGGDLEITTDYRTVLAELLAKRMGASTAALASIFPEFDTGKTRGVFRAA
jgi:uncharacterized protein (DUF1501 family)